MVIFRAWKLLNFIFTEFEFRFRNQSIKETNWFDLKEKNNFFCKFRPLKKIKKIKKFNEFRFSKIKIEKHCVYEDDCVCVCVCVCVCYSACVCVRTDNLDQ